MDDDPVVSMHAADILADAGFRVHEADDGDAAVILLEAKADEVVLLFTDVEMPGSRNGFELAREVDRRWPHVEIVVASGRVKPRDGEMPDKATFIPKPFSANLVLDHLKAKLPDGKKPQPLKQAS